MYGLTESGEIMVVKREKQSQIPTLPAANINYEVLMEYANTYFWSIDETGTILYANECLCAALGYSKQELIGSTAYNLVPEYNSNGNYQWDRIDEVLQNPENPPVRKFELRCKNGDSLWLELRAKLFVMQNTNKRYTITIGLDISHQFRQEQEFKNIHSHLFLSVFFNNALEKDFSFTEVVNYAAALKIELRAPIVCLFFQTHPGFFFQSEVQPNNPDWKQGALKVMRSAVGQSNAAVWDSREGIAALVSLSTEQAVEEQITILVGKISEELKKQDISSRAVLGVSDVCPKPKNISTPYKQARESANLGAFTQPGVFAHYWKKLGAIKLLLDINDLQAEQFIEDQLGPLLRVEISQQNDLLNTLCELLTANSVALMAKHLHIHPKTIAYRRERLEKLLNIDFSDPSTRIDLFVALRLYQIHKPTLTKDI